MQDQSACDRVQANTSDVSNIKIQAFTAQNIRDWSRRTPAEIAGRINELYREWDIERWLETNASSIAFTGVMLGFFFHPYWLILPALVLAFLFQHAVQGWCPPVPILRAFKVRTQQEIDREIFALKVIRGDFDAVMQKKEPLDVEALIHSTMET